MHTELLNNSELLRSVLGKSHIGVWALDTVTRTVQRTLEHDTIFGYSRLLPHWTYETFLEHVLPEDRENVDLLCQRAWQDRSSCSIECRIRRADEQIRWIWVSGWNRRDEHRMTGIIQDITERKKAEEDLRESEKHFRLLAETMLQGVVYQDASGQILSMNPAAERILGKPFAEFIGSSSIGQEKYTIREDGTPFPGGEHPAMVALRTGRPVSGVVMGVFNLVLNDYRWISIDAIPLFRPGENSPFQVYTVFEDITEHRCIENALRESEMRFRSVLDSSRDAIYRINMQTGRVEYISPAAEMVLGFSPEEVIAQDSRAAFDLIHPDDRQAMLDALVKLEETGTADIEYRQRAKDGNFRWLSNQMSLLRDGEGRPQYRDGNIRDVSERKRVEENLRRGEAKFRAVVEKSYDGILIIDADMRIKYVSPAYGRISGFRAAELEGMTATDYIHPEDLPTVLSRFRMLVQMPNASLAAEYRVRHKLGHWFWIESTGTNLLNDPDIQAVVVNCRDVTQRKQVEETLQQSEAKFRLLAQTAEKLLRAVDPQAVVNELCYEAMGFLDCQVYVNYLADDAAGKLHLNACAGLREEEARKTEWLDYGDAVCGCVAQSGLPMIKENILWSSDSRTDLVRSCGVQAYCCHPLKTHDRLIGTLSFGTTNRTRFSAAEIEVMRTIADLVAVAMERVRAENSLRELNLTLEKRVEDRTAEATVLAAQLRELASDLTMTEQRERQRLAKVLHDHIQQMLVAAKLQTTMLVSRQPTESLTASARLVSELLDQTLAASRTLTAELSPPVLYDAGLGPALQWLARHFLEKHGLNIEIEFAPPAEPRTENLRIFMFDAVREALFNVAKHSGVTKARVHGFRGPEGRVHVVVSDVGKGFNPAGLQGGGRSEGFGLFSIQQRIKHLGGRLEIEAAPGKGTRLTLIGPKPRISQRYVPAPVPPAPAEEIVEKPSELGKIRVLLVDDHHIIRHGLAGLLRMDPDIEIAGEASNGAQAINLTRSLLPDVVVMDVSMPVLGGIEATAEIHRDFPEVRVIGLSMHEEGELSSAMRKAGACTYVTKGGAPEALIKAIHAAMQGKASQAQA